MKMSEKNLVIVGIYEGFFERLLKQQKFATVHSIEGWKWREANGLYVKCSVVSDGIIRLEYYRKDPSTENGKESKIASIEFYEKELETLENLVCKHLNMKLSGKLPPLKVYNHKDTEVRLVADLSGCA